ncbi:hypothetical protein [Streptomyces sp. KR80]|uniref:hypothetical protein n=1 Tax=Streptomyces sp. KR80 TaxID=3457426 RepID=UPI003FD47C2C
MSSDHTPEPEGTPDDRVPGAAETADASGAPDTPETHVTAPRRRSTLIAASVAAAVLLAGGGGAYWASTASGDGTGNGSPAAGQGDPPPLRLDGYGRGDGKNGPGIAPGEPDPSGARYRADGPLPDGPDAAAVHRVQGEVTRAQAERLAKALDVQGAPRLVQETWKFGQTRDAAGPTLDIAKKAPGTWTYVRYGAGGGCTEPVPPPEGGKGDGASTSSPARCPAPGEHPSAPDGGKGGDGTGPVSEERAKKAAAPVMKSIGLSDAKLAADQTIGALRIVNAEPVVDGLPTYGWQTGLQVGSDGQVVGGSGHLAELVAGPEYPVLGAEETLKELNKAGRPGKVGIGGCASPVPHKERDGGGEGSIAAEAGTLPCPPRNDAKPKPSTVRDAVFGLAVHFVAGRQALVPSWMFEVELPGATGSQNTYTVTHPAVHPKYLAQSAPGGEKPGDEPTTEPGKPGGRVETQHIDGYSIDGRTLILHFWGGVCSDYSASADVSSGTVKAKVIGKEKKPGHACIKIAKRFQEKVTLDEPLGDRKVVDASSGKAVPKKK